MEDTTISIIAIFLAIITMFVVPFITIADRADDISQLIVQTTTNSFVDDIIKSGKITTAKYERFLEELGTSMNTYNIDMELKILDPNVSKRTTDNNYTIGKNVYYSIFLSQIEEKLEQSATQEIILKEGDIISVTVKNSSTTLSQSIRSIYYKTKGEQIHIIAGTASGIIAINGAT